MTGYARADNVVLCRAEKAMEGERDREREIEREREREREREIALKRGQSWVLHVAVFMSSEENTILKEEVREHKTENGEERGEFGRHLEELGHFGRELEEGGKKDFVVTNSLAFDDDSDGEDDRSESMSRSTQGGGDRRKDSTVANNHHASITYKKSSLAQHHMRRRISKTSAYHDGHRKSHRKKKRNISFMEVEEAEGCTKLFHTRRRVIGLKNCHDEARAVRDVEKFLAHPIVLFKVHHTLWEDIVEEMICKLCSEKPYLNLDVEQTIKSVISNDADYVIPECIQGITMNSQGIPVTEQSYIVVMGAMETVNENQVIMAILEHPFNFGRGAEEIRFICLVLCPTKTKQTKSAIQVARTYATLLADDRLRHSLLETHSSEEFAREFELECNRIHKQHERKEKIATMSIKSSIAEEPESWVPCKDLIKDIKEGYKTYFQDYIEELKSTTSIQKIISTTLFLYFSLLLPGLAFGVLLSKSTGDRVDAKNVVVAQCFGGVMWGLLAGQPLVVVWTTIPVIIYTKIIYQISLNWDDGGDFFYTFYAMTGLSNAFFLIVYAVCGASKVMAYCSRSTEEIVGLFVSIAFMVEAIKYIVGQFTNYYCFPDLVTNATTQRSVRAAYDENTGYECDPNKPLLSLLLVVITVYVGVQIFNFKYSHYLNDVKRVIVADYAIVVAVIAGAGLGSYVFGDISLAHFSVNEDRPIFQLVQWQQPPAASVFAAIGMGLVMSILFFMEGNIAESVVSSSSNKLKRLPTYHLDMLVTGVINAILSIFCLPLVHGSLPHSPLHVRALADIEERVENGHLTEKVLYVRETRITNVVAHILIGCSILMIPYPLNIIPVPVLYALFVYLAITSLGEFQMWERFCLIFTEQSLYPHNHYITAAAERQSERDTKLVKIYSIKTIMEYN
eukprot:sb/3461850/